MRLLLVSLSLVCSSAFSTEWDVDSDGNWNANDNWNPATFPNNAAATATFGDVITATRSVTVPAGSFAVGTIEFDSANSYNILGPGSLAVDSAITVTNAPFGVGHIMSCPVTLTNPVTISVDTDELILETFGDIEGTASITKTGGGLLSLFGANTYSGGTTVSAGVLWGDVNGLQGDITNNSEIIFAQETPGTYSGVISGSGSLEKFFAGTLTLTGVNTWTGGVTISEGLIVLSGSGTLGNGANLAISSGSLVLATDAGTKTIGTLSGGGSGINLNNNELIITQSSVSTFSGVISGTGSIVKSGSSSLFLTGANTYSGGTTVSAGTLQGTTTSLQGAIINNGRVIFTQDTSGTYAGDMSGTGNVAKLGLGTVTFSGTNTYSGGTTVSAGILQGTALSLQGNITNSATVVFAQTDTGTYSGIMSGTGALTKSGAGKLIMSGANTYNGVTTISAGEMQVTGTVASAATVGASGTLSGTGEVSTTINNGTVSPGASIGTLTINGNYTQGAGATLISEINANGASDLLDITGAATLAGTLQINPESGVYVSGVTYTLARASSLSGTFDSLVEDAPLTLALSYSSSAVTLSVIEGGVILPLPIAQLKGNPKEVARYLFCNGLSYTGDLLTVAQTVAQASAENFPQWLNQLGPAQLGALPLVNLQSDTRIATTFVEYIEKHARCQTEQERVFWAEPIGYYYQESGQGQIPFHAMTFGTSVGASKVFANDLVISGGGAYTHSKLKWKENAGTANWDTIYLCPSLGWTPRSFYINGLALFAFAFYDVDRNIPFLQRTGASTHAGMDVLIRGDAGGKFRVTQSGFFLQPEFRLSYLNIFENGYVERGANSVNLAVEKKHTAFIQPQCTLKWIKEWRKGSECFSPALYMGWVRNAPLTDGSYTSQFFQQAMCHPSFTVQSFHKTTDQLILGSELLISTPKVVFAIEYEANIGYSYQVQEGKVRFNWSF